MDGWGRYGGEMSTYIEKFGRAVILSSGREGDLIISITNGYARVRAVAVLTNETAQKLAEDILERIDKSKKGSGGDA